MTETETPPAATPAPAMPYAVQECEFAGGLIRPAKVYPTGCGGPVLTPDEIGVWQYVKALEAERDKLAAFKAYVHKRLDAAGVPTDPESPHRAKGCRIGGRLDDVLACYFPSTDADGGNNPDPDREKGVPLATDIPAPAAPAENESKPAPKNKARR